MRTVAPDHAGRRRSGAARSRGRAPRPDGAPGVRSSSGAEAGGRRRARAPSTSKNVPETRSASTLSVCAPDGEVHGGRPVGQHAGEHGVVVAQVRVHRVGQRREVSRLWLRLRPEKGPGASSTTSRSGSARAAGDSTWSIRPKIAVLAPMPRARVSTTTTVKPGFFGERSQREPHVLAKALHGILPQPALAKSVPDGFARRFSDLRRRGRPDLRRPWDATVPRADTRPCAAVAGRSHSNPRRSRHCAPPAARGTRLE